MPICRAPCCTRSEITVFELNHQHGDVPGRNAGDPLRRAERLGPNPFELLLRLDAQALDVGIADLLGNFDVFRPLEGLDLAALAVEVPLVAQVDLRLLRDAVSHLGQLRVDAPQVCIRHARAPEQIRRRDPAGHRPLPQDAVDVLRLQVRLGQGV